MIGAAGWPGRPGGRDRFVTWRRPVVSRSAGGPGPGRPPAERGRDLLRRPLRAITLPGRGPAAVPWSH